MTPSDSPVFLIGFARSFRVAFKRLRKKYPSLNADLAALLDTLRRTPQIGDSLGRGCYKVRLAIASKGQGKSGGARVIILVVLTRQHVRMLTIFDKSDRENLAPGELDALLEDEGDA